MYRAREAKTCASLLSPVFCFLFLSQTIRSTLNDHLNPADFANPTAVRLGSALIPGIMMTPISSVLGERRQPGTGFTDNLGRMQPQSV